MRHTDVAATAPRSRPNWKSVVGLALTIAIGTRLILGAMVWLSTRAVPRLPLYPAQLPDDFLISHASLTGWLHWDTAHYVAIADVGYGPANPSPGGGLGFFPAWPLLMRGLIALSGTNGTPDAYAAVGLIAANALFLVTVALFALLAAQSGAVAASRTPTLLFTLMPFSFFLNAAYSESLFCAASFGALLLSQRGSGLAAGALGGIASATRLAGLALAPALIYQSYRDGQRGWRMLAPGLTSCWGFVAWIAYTGIRFDDPLSYFRAQSTWGGWTEHVRYYAELFARTPNAALTGDPRHLIILLNLGLALLFAAFLPRVWRRCPPAVAVFTIAIVVAHLMTTWVSLGRYLIPAAGIYIAAGSLLDQPRWAGLTRDLVLACTAIVLATLTILFAHGFWVV